MPGYQYRGTNRDTLTPELDVPAKPGRPAIPEWQKRKPVHGGRKQLPKWTCKKCRRGYTTRYHKEICVPRTAAEYAARTTPGKRRPERWKCVKCGEDYRTIKHHRTCLGEDAVDHRSRELSAKWQKPTGYPETTG